MSRAIRRTASSSPVHSAWLTIAYPILNSSKPLKRKSGLMF
jgi:hypothetical protein